jgi:hypothetical protein
MNRVYASVAIAVIVCIMLILGRTNGEFFWKWRADYHGTVLDKETNQPIPGVYVMGVYLQTGDEPVRHEKDWCVRIVGAYTDQKGRVTIARGPGGIPDVYAIKAGYTDYRSEENSLAKAVRGPTDSKSDELILLRKQVEGAFESPTYRTCNNPQKPSDLAAYVTYLEILLSEYQRYVPNSLRIPMFEKEITRYKGTPGG